MTQLNYKANDIIELFMKKRGLDADVLYKMSHPTKHDLNDVFLLEDCDLFINLLFANKHKQIAIIPDYDADGVMSGSVLNAGLSIIGLDKEPYLYAPTTHTGYGMTEASVDNVLDVCPDTELIITTDNGVAAFDGIAYAKSKGIMVLVSDHHLGGENEPIADVIVDPNRLTDKYPFKYISGTVVIWKILQAYARTFCDQSIQKSIDDLLVFAGISTISDVMQLVDENRYIVTETVALIDDEDFLEHKARVHEGTAYSRIFMGLKGLMDILRREGKLSYGVDEGTIGFYIAPMLNSPRRMTGDSLIGFDLFNQETESEATRMANELFELNEERKTIVNKISRKLLSALAQDLTPGVISLVNSRNGFAGLIAGQVTNKFTTPSIIFTHEVDDESLFVDVDSQDYDDNTVYHGSARSPQNFHIYNALVAIDKAHPEYFKTFGGHGQAAGVGVYAKYYKAFKADFHRYVSEHTEEVDPNAPVPEIVIGCDGAYTARSVDFVIAKPTDHFEFVTAVRAFEKLRPYGEGFRQPGFRLGFSTKDVVTSFMGTEKQHVKFVFPSGLTIIQWNAATFMRESLGHKIAPFFFEAKGRLSINEFRGNVTLQLIADDVVLTEPAIDCIK